MLVLSMRELPSANADLGFLFSSSENSLYANLPTRILYAALSAFPVAFQEVRGWNAVIGALPFLALLLGEMTRSLMSSSKLIFRRDFDWCRFEHFQSEVLL